MNGKLILKTILVAAVGALASSQYVSAIAESKVGITHTALLKTELPNSGGKEVIVWDTEYEPGAINPRHLHQSAITFHVLSTVNRL